MIEQDTRTFSDTEWRIKDGVAYIERLFPDEMLNRDFRLRYDHEKVITETPMNRQVAIKANYGQPGVLSSLYFSTDSSFSEALQDDCVEIETKAIGLNVKVLHCFQSPPNCTSDPVRRILP